MVEVRRSIFGDWRAWFRGYCVRGPSPEACMRCWTEAVEAGFACAANGFLIFAGSPCGK